MAAATETFFGLLADPRCPQALECLFEMKKRDNAKASALLVPHRAAWAELVVQIPRAAALLAARFWPGPLSIALAARPNLDSRLTHDGTVAVRQPGPSVASEIAAAWGAPLTATSANVSGEPACEGDEGVRVLFRDETRTGRLWVAPGTAPGGAPSTIVRVDGERVDVVRPGAIPAWMVKGALDGLPRGPT